jgi:hypothetical protein
MASEFKQNSDLPIADMHLDLGARRHPHNPVFSCLFCLDVVDDLAKHRVGLAGLVDWLLVPLTNVDGWNDGFVFIVLRTFDSTNCRLQSHYCPVRLAN